MMTPEQMRIVIAEQCGWRKEMKYEASFSNPEEQIGHEEWKSPTGYWSRVLPDYPHDLNAIQAEVKQFDLKTLMKFSDRLKAIVEDRLCVRSAVDARYMTLQAPPLWWSEAFIKTVCPEKWKL